jgi:hypothetical protein
LPSTGTTQEEGAAVGLKATTPFAHVAFGTVDDGTRGPR